MPNMRIKPEQMEEDGYSGELIAKVDGIFDGFLADAVDEMREYLG